MSLRRPDRYDAGPAACILFMVLVVVWDVWQQVAA